MAINDKKIRNELDDNKKSHSYIHRRINKTQNELNDEADRISNIEIKLTPKIPNQIIKKGKKQLQLKKALIEPKYDSKTVLTDSTWSYVEIFLKSAGKSSDDLDAVTYWNQARNFYEATESLIMISKPLTTYYCMLNATKALLTHKRVDFDLKHGVSGLKRDGHHRLQNEIITIHQLGVLSGLCRYMQDFINPGVAGESYSLKEILHNLEYIHRAYSLTYNQAELFIPIEDPKFIFDKSLKKGWFQAELEVAYSNKETMKKLTGYSIDKNATISSNYIIRRNKKFDWEVSRNHPNEQSFESFKRYYFNRRKEIRYIYGPEKLWYIKRKDVQQNLIDRSSLTLTYAAMHRLSELSRYDPDILRKHLEGKESWLLTEFITKSITQFIDIISSEITGNDFRLTGFRT